MHHRAELWLLSLALLAGGASPAARADPLFESDRVLPVRITAHLRSLARDRSEEPGYGPATLEFRAAEGTRRHFEVALRPRGKSRRDRQVCSFPPLRLNLPKKQLAGTVFDGQDKLKLVTHCRPSARHERYVYKEFLAYRMLNQVTDASFRVRALDIEWVDRDHEDRAERRFGFLIEHKGRLAARLGLDTADTPRIARTMLDPEHTSLVELFQFLIGNTDFSLLAGPAGADCCHNAAPLLGPDGRYRAVPYDFDISGFVDPPYAVVDHQLPIRNVRRRLYRGFCREGDVLAQALARFREVQPAVLRVVREETALDPASRNTALRYIDSFYALLEDPRALQRQILGACRS